VILGSPLLRAALIGTGGTDARQVVWAPPPAPPAISDGCEEDSRFAVSSAAPVASAFGLVRFLRILGGQAVPSAAPAVASNVTPEWNSLLRP
jgi:hypothetical protein